MFYQMFYGKKTKMRTHLIGKRRCIPRNTESSVDKRFTEVKITKISLVDMQQKYTDTAF